MPIITVASLASDYPAGHLIAEHAHPTKQIIYAIEGVMRVEAEQGLWVVPPGRGLWMPERVLHQIRCVGAVKLRTLYLGGAHVVFPDAVQVFDVSDLMREVVIRLTEQVSSLVAEHLTAILIDELSRADSAALFLPTPKNARVSRIGTALLDNPADQASLQDWAIKLGYSPRTLIRRIKTETGMSFREYRRQARIFAALELLSAGNSVTNTALEVGFESPSAFIQSFKEVMGKTPGQMFD